MDLKALRVHLNLKQLIQKALKSIIKLLKKESMSKKIYQDILMEQTNRLKTL